jgi:hypothetical protein
MKKIFDYKSVENEVIKIKTDLIAPYVSCYSSNLGGSENVSILFKLSLDLEYTWINNIFENSRYMHFYLANGGTLEQFKCSYKVSKKFRKRKVKSIDDLIIKVNKYIEEVM